MKGFKLLCLLFFLLIAFNVDAQDMHVIDSLNTVFKNEKVDTVKVRLLGDISWQYRTNDLKKALEYTDKVQELAQKLNYPYGLSKAYILSGIYNTMGGNFTDAESSYVKAKKIREQMGDSEGVAAVLHDIGTVYLFKGDYDNALDYLLQSLRIEEHHGTKQTIAESYVNIGDVYGEMNKIDEALKYYFQYLDIAKTGVQLDADAEVYNNIGKAYSYKKMNDSSLYYLNLALKAAQVKGDKSAMANSYTGIGHVFLNKKEYPQALENYNKALVLHKEVGNKGTVADVLVSIANAYIFQKEYKKVIETATEALKIAEEVGGKESISNSFLLLAQANEGLGDFKKAYSLQDSAFMYKDSMLNEKSNDKIAEMQTRFETGKKEADNKLLQQQNNIKDLQIKRDSFFRIILITAIILIVFISWLFYSRRKEKQKQLLQAEMMKQQELRSKAVIEAEEQERMRIAKELHDGIGQTLSAVKMNMSTLENSVHFSNPEQKMMMQNAIEMVDDSVREVRSVSHNMMPNALIRAGLAKAVREFINKLNTNQMKIDLDIVGLEERLDQTVETVLYRVIQENVSNIIKHSNANHVNIQLIRHDHELVTMIEDNGVGFDTSNIHSFDGIGLKNIQSRIEYLKGNVSFDSTPGKGTVVTIEIPLSS
jgi:two-component system NarL family sensor kinase